MMKYRIALLSAYIGSPGKNELKITEECRRKMETYGVDVFLFNESHRELLESCAAPNPVYRPSNNDKKNGKIRDWVDAVRFRQFMFPTEKATHNRLLAKLPKMQFYRLLANEYDYYIWLDSKFTLLDDWLDVVLRWIEQYGQHDLVICYHSERNNIASEYEYMKYHARKKSKIICSKYVLKDLYYQVQDYLSDPGFTDELLFEAGFLLYSRSILKHKEFLDAWYAHNYYYTIQDQLSLPYLLQKFNVDVFPIKQSVFKLPGTHYGYWD